MRLGWIIWLLFPVIGYSQINRDSLFANERTMDRRFTLYKGQIRAWMDYGYFNYRSEYDAEGEKTKLSDVGISANMHQFTSSIRYGILDFLDAEMRLQYKNQNYREEPLLIIGPPNPTLNVYTDRTRKSFDDIYLGLNARVPNWNYKFDLGGSVGYFLSTAPGQSDPPEHTFEDAGDQQTINYYHLENWGFGTNSLFYRIFFKYRIADFAISARFQSRVPQGTSEGIDYSWRLNANNAFEYESRTFDVQYPQITELRLMAEYQLISWINLFAYVDQYSSFRGWEMDGDLRYGIPEEKLWTFNPGFEVFVSNRLWLRQGVNMAVSGENINAPFSFYTRFYYNLFTGK